MPKALHQQTQRRRANRHLPHHALAIRLRWLTLLAVGACHDVQSYGSGVPCDERNPCRKPLQCVNYACAIVDSSGGGPASTVQSSEPPGGTSTGTSRGAVSSGGSLNVDTGGSATGGAPIATGGTSAPATGGAPTTTGGSSPLATGGAPIATGGTSAPATGGAPIATGGSSPLATGGAPVATGGTNASDSSTGGLSVGGATSSVPVGKRNGETCAGGAECGSTYCVDSVCCDWACQGQCQACNLKDWLGQCTTITEGQPVNGRPACDTANTTCGAGCLGDTNCTYPDSSKQCDSTTGCIDSHTHQIGTACDGAGHCSVAISQTCDAPWVCNVNTDGLCGKAKYVQVDVHAGTTCAVVSDGTLRCWGSNELGELKLDTLGDYFTPTIVPGVNNVKAVATGSVHTCVLLRNGSVTCWGLDPNGNIGCPNPTNNSGAFECNTLPASAQATKLAVGAENTCALLSNQQIDCWGRNDFGAMGTGTARVNAYSPVKVKGLSTALDVAAGFWHACAVLNTGAVQCWGNNDNGQLGTNNLVSQPAPVGVRGLDGTSASAVMVATTTSSTCALLNDGSIRCWGDNKFGQLGTGDNVPSLFPVQVQSLSPALSVRTGSNCACAIASNKTVSCWGDNTYGQLGNTTIASSTKPIPVPLPNGIAVAAIAHKVNHGCALTTQGSIWCWGDNTYGQIGNNDVTDYTCDPAQVADP